MNTRAVIKLWLTVLPIVLMALWVAVIGNSSYQAYYHRYLEILPIYLSEKGRSVTIRAGTMNVGFIGNSSSTSEMIVLSAESLQTVKYRADSTPQGTFVDIPVAETTQPYRMATGYGSYWFAVAVREGKEERIEFYQYNSSSHTYAKRGEKLIDSHCLSLLFHWYGRDLELLVGTQSNRVFAYTLNLGRPLLRASLQLPFPPMVLAFSQKNTRLVAGSTALEVVSMENWQKSQRILLPSSAKGIAFCDDDRFVVSVGGKEAFVYSSLNPKTVPLSLEGSPASILSLTYAKSISCLIAGDEGGNLTLWRRQSNGDLIPKAVQVVKAKSSKEIGPVNGILSLSLNPDQQWFATLGARGALYLWNTESLLRGARL